MSYRVIYPRDWDRRLRRLPPHVSQRMRQVAIDLGKDPRPRGYRGLRPKGNGYRVRVLKDWRMIYDIDDRSRIVEIRDVFARGRARY